VRADEFAARIDAMTGGGKRRAKQEVDASISRLFTYGAWADKYDGAVHHVPIRGVAIAMNEPIGVIGIACPDTHPLLGMISLVAPAIATGNTTIVIPSQEQPLAVTDFYSVLETSDVPAGVVNIVTGDKDALSKVLAEHDDVEAMWYFGGREGVKAVELASASNMKRTWATWHDREWLDRDVGEGREFLRAATHVKNIWVPYGE
jgi:aldehyde dehydrogenase (NAD+)